MNTFTCFGLALVMGLAVDSAVAQRDPDVPSEVLQAWSDLIGDWDIEGDVGGRIVTGKATFEWAPGNHCYVGKQVWKIGPQNDVVQLTLIGGWDAQRKETVEQGFSSAGGSATVRYANDLKDPEANKMVGQAEGFEARGRKWAGVATIERPTANEYVLSTAIDGRNVHRLKYQRVRAPEPNKTAAHAVDVAAIKQLADDWRAGWLAGDAGALVALYVEDPVLMPEGQPAIVGRAAIRAIYDAVFEECTVQGGGKIVEVEVAGDWGYYRSSYTLTAMPKAGGEKTEDTGKSLFIVRRQADGAWKIARLIANSDLPPAAE